MPDSGTITATSLTDYGIYESSLISDGTYTSSLINNTANTISITSNPWAITATDEWDQEGRLLTGTKISRGLADLFNNDIKK
jgi:hypothetical protein